MLSPLRLSGFCSLVLLCAWACQPNLDDLVAGNTGGSGGTVAGTGGTDTSGGAGGSTGGGTGGDIGADGGTLGAGDTAGIGAGGDQSLAGDGGAPPVGPSICDNLERDENESDVDCGGLSACPRCEAGLQCTTGKDCASRFCKGMRCAEPTCADDVKNQGETGIDCGGPCAPDVGCALDVACEVNQDCASEFCKNQVCVNHCGSGKRELDETDKDCGGADCEPCADDQGCAKAADCQSKICFNNVCQAATCDDKVQNQDESDKDCGGVCVVDKPCQVGDGCNGPADCDSYVCTTNACAPDLDVPAGDFIDDFEDADLNLTAVGGRVASWYAYGDGSGIVTEENASIPGKRGPYSARAIRTTGKDYTGWGSGVGVDMNNAGGQQSTKMAYDASAYSGVTFWARAESALTVTVVFPDIDTDATGGAGNCTTCDHHWFQTVQVGTSWQRYTVLFADLTLEPLGVPEPSAFAPDALVSLQFRMFSGLTYELWLDDVAFVE